MADRYEEKAREIRDAHFLSIAAANTRHGLAAACDVVERALADALRDQDAWHEIDDPEHPAPRDGTELIGLAGDNNIFRIWHGRTPRGAPAWVSYGGAFVAGYITHYRALPPPPTTGRERG